MQSELTNVVNPYLTDVGVGLVFGLGYYFIKYIYGEKKDDKKLGNLKEGTKDNKSKLSFEDATSIEDFNYLIKQNEDNYNINPFEIIDKINKKNLPLEISVYNNLLNQCLSSKNFEMANKLYDEMFDYGSPVQPDLSTFNILLKGISIKLDRIDPNVQVELKEKEVDFMSNLIKKINILSKDNIALKPNNITINTCLDILIKAGEIDKAWETFETMEDKYEVKPDKYSYSTIIKALKYKPDNNKLNIAYGIIEFIKNQEDSASNDEIVFNCLIDVCIKLEEIEKAENLFKEMKKYNVEPSKITYAIMIKGYGQHFMLDKAFSIFEEMKISNLSPNEIIYGCLLNACVRSSDIKRVTEIYQEMKKLNLDMNIVLYTTLIKAYTKNKDLKSALEVYYTMLKDEKVKPNIVIYNAILDSCVECYDINKLNEIYNQLKENVLNSKDETNQINNSTYKTTNNLDDISKQYYNLSPPQPDLITYSTVIKGYARAKQMDKVFDIYNFLKENSDQFKLDEVVFNIVLDGCAKTNNFKKAMEIYDDMKLLKINKSNVLYSILIKNYANNNDHNSALSLLEEMKENNIKPGVITYTCLIQSCLKSKKFDKAISLFEEMKEQGAKSDYVLYNTIVNGCLYNQKWELACKYTLESFDKKVKMADDIYKSLLFKISGRYCNLDNEKKIKYAKSIMNEMKLKGLTIPEDVCLKVGKMMYYSKADSIDIDKISVSSKMSLNDNYIEKGASIYDIKSNKYNKKETNKFKGDFNRNKNYNLQSNNPNNNYINYNNFDNLSTSNHKIENKDNLKFQRKGFNIK